MKARQAVPLWISFGVVLIGGMVLLGYVVFPSVLYWMALPDGPSNRIAAGFAMLLALTLLHAGVALRLVWTSSAAHASVARRTTRFLAGANMVLCIAGAIVGLIWWVTDST